MVDAPGFDAALLSREAASLVRFARLVLDLDACILARDSGEAIPLTRGEFAVLRMLVSRPGRVISRDALLDAFADRRFEPFDRSVDVLIGKLRRKIEADPKQPRLIVTVPFEGYRFDGLRLKPPETVKPDADSGSNGSDAGPPRLSLVVLPFANTGGDVRQDYFVDGVTESLTTDLSRIRGALVIGRSTAFSYKGKSLDLRQIGRDLNVRYVLEGSVQRAENRMRVNVQLIEAETGAHLWAERFDKPLADLFDMQDEIVARLANQLQAELIEVEARRAEQKPNPDSMDLYFQGLVALNHGYTAELLAKARGFFERALELDAGNVDALVGLGNVDVIAGHTYQTDDPAPLLAAAEANLTKALAVAPNHAGAHRFMGYLLFLTNRAPRGIEELDRALAIDPNAARAHGLKGFAKIYLGRAEEAEAHVREAMRLSPRDRSFPFWLGYIGIARAYLGEDEAAVEWLRKSIDANRNTPWNYFLLAACLARLGRLDDARAEVKAGFAVNPKFVITRYRAFAPSDNAVVLAQRERIVEGMRMAGVPEGYPP
jgi:TolB-like protein